MTNTDIEETIAYCGLICNFCFQGEKCTGCKSTNTLCDIDISDEGCYQKQCCTRKGYDGCWACDELNSCEEGIYSLGNYSKIKAFALYIKKHGKDVFIQHIVRNNEKGLNVEKGKDYDNRPIADVLEMIENGKVQG